ncbi:MAG TPA: AMP-binding protein [Thermodesulfobacteriota bacterium]|nr:AMP-binding protein [Thermodesulfobacteriota bacterium]
MIAEKLNHWAEKEPEKTALQIKLPDGYQRITYLELRRLCLRAASQLREQGLNRGDHISLYGTNTPGWAIAYLAIHLLGGVVIPLDAQLNSEDILSLLKFSDSKAVIADKKQLDELARLLTNDKAPIRLISIESLSSFAERTNGFKAATLNPDDLMSIIFTSGTTGSPKGVQLTCKNILNNVEAILSQIKVSSKDNVLNILPLHHVFSCTVGFLAPLIAGATITFSYSLKSTDLLSAMRETGVTIFPAVPKLFALLDREIFRKVDSLGLVWRMLFWSLYAVSRWVREKTGFRLGSIFFRKIHEPFGRKLRFFASGGAKLDAGISERFLNLGFVILEGYGLTETSPVISITRPNNPMPGTAGRPVPGVEVRIDSPGPDGVGEICVRGPNVMRGYYKNETATGEVLRHGWLHTGDLGMVDPKGNITIIGRAKEVIVLPSGKNIYPEDVERHYEKIPLVKEICVLPSLTDHGEVRGLLMVVVPEKKEIAARGVFNTRERIRSEVANTGSSLPSYMQVTELQILYDELPKTRLGKLKRGEIEKLVRDQKYLSREEEIPLSPEEKALLEAPYSARFLKRLQEIADIKGPFYPSQDLSIDLGLDSLTLIEVTVLLEKEFEVKLKEDELPRVRTIGDMLNLIEEVRQARPDEVINTHIEEEKDLLVKNLFDTPPSPPLEDVFNLNRGLVKRLLVRTLQLITSIILRVAFRIRIEGLNKIPREGAVLICPNHQSFIDPILIYALMPGRMLDRLMFLAFGEFFRRPPISWIIKLARVVLTGSSQTLGESLRLCYAGLKRDMVVCIFPEGGRTNTGTIMPPRLGAGILSVETGAPIVPILIEGAIDTLSHLHPEFRFAKIRITVGDPIKPPPKEDNNNKKNLYQDMVDKWKEAVLGLEKKQDE